MDILQEGQKILQLSKEILRGIDQERDILQNRSGKINAVFKIDYFLRLFFKSISVNLIQKEFDRTIIINQLQLFKKLNQLQRRAKITNMQQNNQLSLSHLNPIITQNQQVNPPTAINRAPSLANKLTTIKLVSKTWSKDSYGLFDYQAKTQQYTVQNDTIQETTYIVRNNIEGKTIFRKDLSQKKIINQPLTSSIQSICHFMPKQQQTVLGQLIVDRTRLNPSFKIKIHKETENSENSKQSIKKQYPNQIMHSLFAKHPVPFILADAPPSKNIGYPLKPGNIIKFGRVQYLVLQIFNGKATQSARDSKYLDDADGVFDVFEYKQNKKINRDQTTNQKDRQNINCKICLCNQQTQEDPLISPCDCKGFCGLIHTHCLKTWINNKVKKENDGLTTSYNFTKFSCQICKAPFPKVVRTQQQQVQMMTILKPERPYIILQSLDPLNNQYAHHIPATSLGERQRLLHVISTDQKQSIKIGRATECEIRLMDISVSRKHAQIKLSDNQFYIKDTGSKFGTLIEWKNTTNNSKGDMMIINRKRPLTIQLGRTSFQFTVQDVINQEVDTQ